MESEYARLTDLIRTRAHSHPKRRFLVAIAGPPGSGKTTIAREVVQRLNSLSSSSAMQVNGNSSETAQSASPAAAVLVSMDGFHFPRAALDQLPNREEAYIRRGAPWTFDVDRFVAFMRELRAWADRNQQQHDAGERYIYAPSFDHQLKDPVEDGLQIPSNASILIIEGNYLLLDEPQWRDIADLIDYRVFVDANVNETRERVAKRHVQAGIEKTIEDAYRRVDRNDALNGMLIREKLIRPDLVVRSVDDMVG
jgi:pantothenate kinase